MDPTQPLPRRRMSRWLRSITLGLVLFTLVIFLGGWLLLRGSLPTLTGRGQLPGLHGDVTIERDANGVPTIHAADREDAMRALGYLHAQDRFFGMDLLRRKAAGELSELFGAAALAVDKDSRKHRFRRQAREVIRLMPPDKLQLLKAYAQGVNTGLAALPVRPWEYLLLRVTPRPWEPEDTMLVTDTMVIALENRGGDERTRLAIADVYGEEALPFLQPLITEATAALDGSSQPAPPVPDAAQMRPRTSDKPTTLAVTAAHGENSIPALLADWLGASPDHGGSGDARPGSNNFALAGSRVAGGGALVANDPHLGLSVPAIWYRASFALPGGTCTGVTLPGAPAMILGSNGHVAWAFTNGQIDTSDIVIVERDPADSTRYRVPDGSGWEKFEIVHESIPVAHGRPVAFDHTWTRWGPVVVDRDRAGRTLALHWSEYDPVSMNVDLADMLDARTVDDALAVAHRTGQHPQNFVTGDSAGHIAWSILGLVPRRIGFEGTMPVSWADGTHRWDGFLRPDEVPVIRDPADGQLWTANNRVVGGDVLKTLGFGGYGEPARAAQIRDRLTALAGRPATAADGLAVQLDDEAIFLGRWRKLLDATLTDEVVSAQPGLRELRDLVQAWHGHATTGETGYRLVREFRRIVSEMVLDPIYAPVRARDEMVDVGYGVEQPLWSLVTARPAYLLPAGIPSWDALLRQAAVKTSQLGEREQGHPALRDCTWGRFNVLRMRHPFSALLPRLGTWLDMPAQSLPGDTNMPRVQQPTFGASMRMVVIPGREKDGIFEQPGGASGHFLSPFYRAGHADWADGRPSPFLPGLAKYRLVLRPGG